MLRQVHSAAAPAGPRLPPARPLDMISDWLRAGREAPGQSEAGSAQALFTASHNHQPVFSDDLAGPSGSRRLSRSSAVSGPTTSFRVARSPSRLGAGRRRSDCISPGGSSDHVGRAVRRAPAERLESVHRGWQTSKGHGTGGNPEREGGLRVSTCHC